MHSQELQQQAADAYAAVKQGLTAENFRHWHTSELAVLRQEGVVDVKVTVDVTNRSSTYNLLLVDANMMRLRREGVQPVYVV